MFKSQLVIIGFLLLFIPAGFAEEISHEKALELVTERLEKLERFVVMYSLTDPGNPQMKKLILMGRDTVNFKPTADETLRVQEELYWYSNGRYPKEAPIHTLGFSDGKSSYHWSSENNSSNTQTPPSYLHVQIPPSIYLFTENWTLSYIPFFLKDAEKAPNFNPDQFSADLTGDELTIQLNKIWGRMDVEFVFDLQKGLKKSVTSEPMSGTIIVDEFQEAKDGIWFPKRGRLVKKGKPDVTVEILKVLVNDDVDPALFKNFPWDDPKYNTKFNMSMQDGQMRRENRILFKDHPPSYFTSFFGISQEDAYQMYMEIE